MNLIIKRRIMFGVYALYLMRKLRTPLISEAVILTGLLFILFSFVSVPNVLTNMSSAGNFASYLMMAFSHTELLIQITVVLAIATTLFFLRSITMQTVLKRRLV